MRACRAAILLSPAGAAAIVAAPAVAADLRLSLSRGVVDGRPVIRVAITNQSRDQMCVRKEVLRNPASGEMQVRLRDSLGRAVAYRHGGFIDPPIEGPVRIAPGETVRLHNFLDSAFRLPNDGIPFPGGMTAQISFRYGYCPDIWSFQATSRWQRI